MPTATATTPPTERARPPDRDGLVREHLGFARYLARRFHGTGEAPEDLDQVAYLGLVAAANRYDPDRGGFMGFAAATISGELKRHLRDHGWGLRVPRRLQELNREAFEAVRRLEQELQRSPSVAEVAAAVGADQDEVLEAFEAGRAYRPPSLDASGPGEDGSTALADTIGDDDGSLERAERVITVRRAIAELPERDKKVLDLRFYEGMTQAEIADRVGVSQVHVSRILHQSLDAIRERAGLEEAVT
jgi:RNA polymerase sigma-B factor